MIRSILVPFVVAATLAAGAASAQERDSAQSYGYTDREGATYEEAIAEPGDAYASVYGSGRADDYHDYGDYGPADSRGAPGGIVSDVANDGRVDPLIVPDRYGRDGAYAMARVVGVDPLVTRGQGCRADDRYAAQDGYRGEYAGNDGYYEGDEYYEGDDYYRGGYAGGGDGYYRGQPGGYADPYGRPQPRASGMGAAIGAIIGGVIGNQVADDDDHYYGYGGEQAAATMIGAVLGGAIGAGIEREAVRRREQAYYGAQQRGYGGQGVAGPAQGDCGDRVAGYRVTYEYAGRRYEAVTDYDPGDEMRVRIEVPR